MIEANDFIEHRKKIEDLISEAQEEQAAKQLMDFVREFSDEKEFIHEVVVLKGKITRITTAKRKHELTFSQMEERLTPLLFNALELMDRIELHIQKGLRR